jgi:NDP-sugar pyrophosphorylase family protein/lipopolysaccharide/colanic/teichoic acid biosynthesis glycosyltransferase
MQVILLATDEQRPLPPLTNTVPAPMLPVVDRPVMATTVEILARAGHKQILISLYERGGQIASYFGDGRRWGLDIKYLTLRQAWGSAGALRFAGSLVSESVLVLPGSAVIDLDLEAALAFHRAHGRLATAILHPARRGAAVPLVQVGADNRLLGPGDEAPCHTLSATQAYILEPGALAYIPRREPCDITADLLPALHAANEPVYGYSMAGYWNPLDSIAAYQEVQEVFLYSAYRQRLPDEDLGGPEEQVRFPSLEARQVAPGIWVGRDHSIHPTAKIAAPTYIGPNSWIGREVELGPATVIGAGVVIDEEATIARSSVLSQTYVGRLVNVADRVVTAMTISDVASGETTRVVDPFLISHVGAANEGLSPFGRGASALAASLILLLLSPLLLLVALATLLTTGGLLTRVPRVSQHRPDGPTPKLVQLLRFRTRRASGAYTPLGRLIERWDLHRLPELFNVLSGEIALVGVKPLEVAEAIQLTEEWHERRYERPAGFTGLWYLQTDPDSSLDAVIVADVYYTATRTRGGDLLCLLRTPGAWLRRARVELKQRDEREVLAQAS